MDLLVLFHVMNEGTINVLGLLVPLGFLSPDLTFLNRALF